jgi:hypothetical protein
MKRPSPSQRAKTSPSRQVVIDCECPQKSANRVDVEQKGVIKEQEKRIPP